MPNSDADFPRVLLVTSSLFNPYSGGGVTLTNLFRAWPKDHIAGLHSECLPLDTSVCKRYYELGLEEIRPSLPLIGHFRSRNRKKISESVEATPQTVSTARSPLSLMAVWMQSIIGDGYPEKVMLSRSLRVWIDDFRPQVMYTLLGSLRYIRLVRILKERLKIPVVVHMMDDWPEHLYRRGIWGPRLRQQMLKEFTALVHKVELCMGICDMMCEEYERRYSKPFLSFHNPVDAAEWVPVEEKTYKTRQRLFRIVYWGSIMKIAQLNSLLDMGRAISELRRDGMEVEFQIYTQPYAVQEFGGVLNECSGLRIQATTPQDDFVRVVSDADLLFLPVNFEKDAIRYLRLSFPTKLPPYLVSGTPILAYGPDDIAQIRYLKDRGLAHLVTRRGEQELRRAVRLLINDDVYRQSLGQRARNYALAEEEGQVVRRKFQDAIRNIVAS